MLAILQIIATRNMNTNPKAYDDRLEKVIVSDASASIGHHEEKIGNAVCLLRDTF